MTDPANDERPLLPREAIAALGTIQSDVGLTQLLLAALIDHAGGSLWIPSQDIGRAVALEVMVQTSDEGVAVSVEDRRGNRTPICRCGHSQTNHDPMWNDGHCTAIEATVPCPCEGFVTVSRSGPS